MTPPVSVGRVVAFGGGHGLAASLQALRQIDAQVTAVVTVADDGGSSGRLRREFGALPPGDLRMALAALVPADEWSQTWASLLQYRFGGAGALAGHPVGNLMLTGLTDLVGDPVRALDLVARLLRVEGRVLPSSPVPLEIVADVVDGQGLDGDGATPREVRGQVAVATCDGRVVSVRLEPARPPACVEAVQAVWEADWVVLGPGSLFTSVIPHLLVPQLADALAGSPAQRLLTLNLAAQPGETSGFSPTAHLEALAAHAPDLRIDVVLADAGTMEAGDASLESAAATMGARVVALPVACDDGSPRHDVDRLAKAYDEIFRTD